MSPKQVKDKLQLIKANDIRGDATGVMVFLHSKAKFASKLVKNDTAKSGHKCPTKKISDLQINSWSLRRLTQRKFPGK